MELSIHQAAKRLGEVFPYAWQGPLADQTYGGRTVRFVGDAALTGTVVGDAEGFTVTGEAKVIPPFLSYFLSCLYEMLKQRYFLAFFQVL